MVISLFKSIYRFFRANFFAGLFIAVPFAITIAFLIWLWEKIDEPLLKVFTLIGYGKFNYEGFKPENPWSRMFYAIDKGKWGDLLEPVIGLLIVLFFVLFLGVITRSIIGRMFLLGIENVVARLPVIGIIYTSLKQLGEAFISTDGKSKFQRTVIVQFPYKGCWAIGFVTGKAPGFLPQISVDKSNTELLTIFVPMTPLPTGGFTIVIPESETIPLEISVQDAMKLVVSGGVIAPGVSGQHKAQGSLTRIMVRETDKSGKAESISP